MNILAIETSCDETAVAVIRDGRHILANVISSQIALHQQYGGVVPELASREHIVNIVPVLQAALARSGLTWEQIDAIAVTRGPGLAGALLVGVNTGKALAFALDKPFIGINHMEGHIYSNWLIPEDAASGPAARLPSSAATPSPAPPPAAPAEELPWQSRRLVGYGQAAAPPSATSAAPAAQPALPVPQPQSAIRNPQSGDPQFPLIALVVSGGHTELLYMTGHGEYQMLGRTVDDAAGEAFDKVARILGLGYPGGPAVQRAAERGNPAAFEFPHSVMRGSFDFSFSGLKTAVLRKVNEFGPPLPEAPPAPPPAPVVEAPPPPAPVAAASPSARPAPPDTNVTDELAPGDADEPARPPVRMLGNTATTRPIAAEPPPPAEKDEDEEDEPAPPAPTRPPTPRSVTPPMTASEPVAPAAPPRPPARPTTPARPPASQTPATGPTANPPATPPRRATPTPEPPPPAEPARPTPPRRTQPPPGGPGLIRVESERPSAQPLPTPMPPEPIPPAPTRREPRVLGTEGERPAGPDPEIPAFLQRGTPPARPTSIRSRQKPNEPEVPAFLRNRATTPPAEEEGDEEEELRTPRPLSPGRSVVPPRPQTPPPPATPTRPPGTATPPAAGTGRSAEPPARPTPTRPATPPPSPPQRRDPTAPTPPPTSARPTPRSTEPGAPPTRRPARPAAEDEEIPIRPAPRTPPPAPRSPIRPVPKPQPLAEREITPIPKSVQAGRPANDEDEDIDLDDEDSLATPRPARPSQIWSDWLEDIIDGDDDPPPPRRRPVPLEGPRRPDASVRLPGSGKPATPAVKPPLPVADVAAAFQDAAVDILVEKTVLAVATYRARTVLLAGGVAANRPLRERLRERLGPDIDLRYPPLIFCTDNAAMIAAAAFFRYDAGLQTDWSLDIDPNARYWE